jgi:hypothetical protein
MFDAVKDAAKLYHNFDYKSDCLIADAAPAIHVLLICFLVSGVTISMFKLF